MRIYLGDIERIYEKTNWPLGSIAESDGKRYQFVKVAGEKKLIPGEALTIDKDFVAILAAGNIIDAFLPIYLYVPSGESRYVWVQVEGELSNAFANGNTIGAADKLLGGGTNDGEVAALAVSGTYDDAEIIAIVDAALGGVVRSRADKALTDVGKPSDLNTNVTIARSTTSITGVNTKFTQWFRVGDKVVLPGGDAAISVITSDTAMTTTDSGSDNPTSVWSIKRYIVPVLKK